MKELDSCLQICSIVYFFSFGRDVIYLAYVQFIYDIIYLGIYVSYIECQKDMLCFLYNELRTLPIEDN